MTIRCKQPEHYDRFFKNGGTLNFEIDVEDICSRDSLEELEDGIQGLETGFELPPPPVFDEQSILAQLCAYGSSWLQIVTRVYLRKGKIVYNKLPSGTWAAECTIPIRPQ